VALFSDLGVQTGPRTGRVRFAAGIEGIVADAAAGPVAGVPAAANGARVFVQLEMTGLSDIVELVGRQPTAGGAL
jgi:hypothetical protein